MRIAINVAVFYAAWFAAVLAAAKGWAVEATLVSLAVVLLHLLIEKDRKREISIICAAGVFGVAVETIMVQSGLAVYAADGPVPGFAPAWLVAMWMAFATLFNVSLKWMQSRLWLAILFAAIGGPASYFAGMKMGGMTIAEPVWISLAFLAVMWAIAFPILLILARQGAPSPPA